MPLSPGKTSWRVRPAIPFSSSEALPARSPRPLIVHSTWRAPFNTADSEFATASPRSLWQCTDHTALSEFGIRSRSEEHTSELQSLTNLVCRLLLEKKKKSKIECTQVSPGRTLN